MIGYGRQISACHFFFDYMKAVYRIAELNIEISSLYERVHRYCEDYEAGENAGEPDIRVEITEDDIEAERAFSDRTRAKEGRLALVPTDDYLEELAVYRKICEKLPYHDRFLFHGSALAMDGEGFLFTAPSGTGKSTHARLWREVFGDKVSMINDDKPVIGIQGNEIRIFGTPWNGKHRLGTNTSVPLKAICFLQRGENNSITEVSREQILPKFMGQVFRPSDKAALGRVMGLTDIVTKSVKHYILTCNMDPEAAVIAHKMMTGER